MFSTQFAVLFKAVERIRQQLKTADDGLRSHLTDELLSLRNLNNRYIDSWMKLDEEIQELLEEAQLERRPPTLSRGNQGPSVNPAKSRAGFPASSPAAGEFVQHNKDDLSTWLNLAFENEDLLEVSLRKGIGYFDLLMFDQASDFLNDYLKHADHPIARLFLGATYLAKREVYRAQRELHRVRELTNDPLLICATNELDAHMFAQRGQFDEAIVLLTQVAQLMPNYPDVWYNLGLSFSLTGRYAKSIQALYRSLQLDPANEDSSHLLALVLLKAGDVRGSKDTIDLALQYHPRNPDLLMLKSELAWMEQHYDEGVEACRKVLQVNPRHPTVRSVLAKGLIQQGKLSEAIGVLKMQLTMDPKHPSATVQLGVAYLLAGYYERSEQCILTSMVPYSNKGFLWLVLGRISARRGDAQQSYHRYLRAMRDGHKPVKRLALYLYGLTLFEEGRFAESDKYLKAAQVLGQPNAAITILLAKSAEARGNMKEARYLMQSVSYPHPT